MTGRSVIGIASVGEKVFFALSYYYNEAARNGDNNWLRRCLFNREFAIIKNEAGNNYIKVKKNILTNVNFDKGVPQLWKNTISNVNNLPKSTTYT